MFGISPTLFLIPLAAYVLGSIPFGLILAKLFGGGDVRKAGSGNIGATNVARVVGPVAGILTLLFDTLKGVAAVLLAARFTNDSASWMMIAAFVVLLGHCFPIWLKFKGGKGVASVCSSLFLLGRHLARFYFLFFVWFFGDLFRSVLSRRLRPCRCLSISCGRHDTRRQLSSTLVRWPSVCWSSTSTTPIFSGSSKAPSRVSLSAKRKRANDENCNSRCW
jgi:acyl-phosphate glycerol 3-phosphate acyltransferase